MPERIVNADPERSERRAAATNQTERVDRGMAIAAILQAIPLFVWAAPFVLLFGFVLMALWYNRTGNALHDFTSGVLLWASRVLIVGGVVLLIAGLWRCYKLYHDFMLDATVRRTARAGATKAIAAARGQELKNDLTQADIQLRQKMPQVILALTQAGVAFKYDAKGTLEVLGPAAGRTIVNQIGGTQEQLGAGAQAAIAGPADDLPTNVLYQDVRGQVPKGHILVGVGRGGAVETKDKAVGACVWIVGLSGTGKTSTTVLRVEERASMGHGFLGVDPHFFKDDSLYHAIYEIEDKETGAVSPGPYKSAFIKPMACLPTQQKEVLQHFLNEFNGRKGGRIPKSQWRPITLLVDEVGALMDPTTEEEEEIAKMLPSIARICGQEARNFMMGGVFISQQATGLAWLRKMALMVIVHQLLMQSEKELACNGDKAAAKAMETWPIGRTYIFGVGFQEGPRTVQQPYFRPAAPGASDDQAFEDDSPVEDANVVDAADPGQEQETKSDSPVPALTGDVRRVYDAVQQLLAGGYGVNARDIGEMTGFKKDKANGLLNRLADLGYITRRKAV